jgi:hypothetical protein
MRRKELKKKLFFEKQTIANLNIDELNGIHGGHAAKESKDTCGLEGGLCPPSTDEALC